MLTPIDIQNHTLKTSMSGYNKKDTEEFLASILDSYETLFRENRTLKEKITSLSEGIQYYKEMENTLQKALILAEKTSTETQEAAKEKADAIVKDAQSKADSIIKDIKAEANNIKAEAKEDREEARQLVKESEEKAEALTKESEEKAEALIKESEEKAETIIKEAEEKAKQLVKEAEEKAEQVISNTEKHVSDIKSQAQDELDSIRISSIRLVQDYEKYCSQVKKLATKQLALLESNDYKLRVTELNIDDNNGYTKDNPPGEVYQDKNEKDITDEKDITENIQEEEIQEEIQEDVQENNKEEDSNSDSGNKSDTENEVKFSWNNDESEHSTSEEPETPFTFIDL